MYFKLEEDHLLETLIHKQIWSTNQQKIYCEHVGEYNCGHTVLVHKNLLTIWQIDRQRDIYISMYADNFPHEGLCTTQYNFGDIQHKAVAHLHKSLNELDCLPPSPCGVIIVQRLNLLRDLSEPGLEVFYRKVTIWLGKIPVPVQHTSLQNRSEQNYRRKLHKKMVTFQPRWKEL